MSSSLLRIGQIVGFHGLKGEMKVRPASPNPDWVDSLKRVVLVQGQKTSPDFSIVSIREQAPGLIIRIKSIDSRTDAEKWLKAELYAYERDLPEPEEGSYRFKDIVGLRVLETTTQEEKGKVVDLLSSSGLDYLEIELLENQKTIVVPFTHVFVPQVDLTQGILYVDKLGDLADLATQNATEQKKKKTS